ncbi:unnamed protein product [Medioppia subpectinata]|uniref:Uncharacterized protein n=1 Tax=Medioppia subpectinata TaxID=1979941 RepID=A0A7R9KLD7_9ACAR|nr:unnamed protein product [Medioppia subpectinata]CAG2105721.1 unnamed protein product [Medioppia subpectinata]
MRVKWNRNLDGIRPLITVPETDVISSETLDVEDLDNKTCFTDLNDNTTESNEINGTNGCDNVVDAVLVRTCESPCPSSVSISSKRSDKSRRISSLFGLFRIKDKNIDNNSEDCVSNFSELSGATIPSLISHSMSKRKSSYGSRDSILLSHEKIGFEADTRRRRRANSLLAKGSMRRSWQQLNGSPKLPIISPPSASTDVIIKVKVKKEVLPESELVSFPSSTIAANKSNTDGAIVLTFVDDEPMIKDSSSNESIKDIFVKSAPIQGILRVRSRESDSPDYNTTDGLTKTTEQNSAVTSLNDKKSAANRRPTQPNTTGSTVTAKRMTNTKINASNASTSKRDVRSTHALDDRNQIQTLTQLCDSKTKQLKTLGISHNYTRIAFDSLSVVIQHLIEQYEPFETPRIKRALKTANTRCEQLRDNIDAKDVELNDMKIIFEEQINHLMKEREKNFSDLNEAKVTHELNIKKLKEMHFLDIKKLEEKHSNELMKSQQNCNELVNEIEEKTTELNETKQTKEELTNRLNQMEANIMNDKSKKFKYLSEKSKQLELEVESLKVVMEMKNEKIHTLERKMIETQEKINELPFAKESIRSLQQQIETLQITLDRKIHQFNQLTREHHDLQCLYEKEMREKRRLSMKNEELAFHLSESFNESVSGLSNCSHLDANHTRFKSPAINMDETPIKTNRCISGINNSYSNRKSHSKVNRSKSISTTTTTTTTSLAADRRATPMANSQNGPISGSPNDENHFLSNSNLDEVFDSGTNFVDCHSMPQSIKKGFQTNRYEKCNITGMSYPSDETPPQCILDSGFEEIQGLNSLSK